MSVGASGTIALQTDHAQSIFLATSADPVLGSSITAVSESVRSELHANRNSGEEAAVTLHAEGGSTELIARNWASAPGFAAGVHATTKGLESKLDLGIATTGPYLKLDHRTDVSDAFAVDLDSTVGPAMTLSHRKSTKPVGSTSIALFAGNDDPKIVAVHDSEDAWKLTSSKK